MSDTDYIHTFSKKEQDRLIRQSELVAPFVHKNIDFSKDSKLLEIGCGVGAQIRIICRKYPQLAVSGIDISDKQIRRAQHLLGKEIADGRVFLDVGSADRLPYDDEEFDVVFICFVLEHLDNPSSAVAEAMRVLKKGGKVICTEVFNDALYIFPESPAIMSYWGAFNSMQKRMGGDPNIGVRLCNIMSQAGFDVSSMEDASYMLDRRMTNQSTRAEYLEHWYFNFMSAKTQLLDTDLVDGALLEEFEREYAKLRKSEDAVFLYSNRQVTGYKG